MKPSFDQNKWPQVKSVQILFPSLILPIKTQGKLTAAMPTVYMNKIKSTVKIQLTIVSSKLYPKIKLNFFQKYKKIEINTVPESFRVKIIPNDPMIIATSAVEHK